MSVDTSKIIAVVGANGRSGQAFVTAAVAAGYTVRAGIHHGSVDPTPGVEVVTCDATNPSDVAKLIAGADYVVSLIGHVPKSPKLVQTQAIRVIINQMNQLGVRRLVSLTGTGVRIKGDKPSLLDIMANLAIRVIDTNRVTDGIAHVREIESSGLDWTIVRVLKLGSGDPHTYTLTPHGPAKAMTARAEVANAILSLLDDASSYHTYPVISR